MTKRSDLAQKLLDDLRLRKEQMGLARSEQSSAQTPSICNGNSHWSFQGSGEAATRKLSNKNTCNPDVTNMWLSTRHHRSPSLEGASNVIIPAGERRRKEQNIDVSMALALALSNIGKIQNIEPFGNAKVGNKLILRNGSLSFRETDGNMLGPSLEQLSFLSPLQIGEISQNLGMILKACSNGLSYSRDSIDIGRELLKGAIDLEESLRMLMSLQDASDYMVGSKAKQIKLLKSKEEDESSSEENKWKLTKPVFSFDGSPRYSNSLSREGIKAEQSRQKQMALAYQETLKVPKVSSNKISNASLQFNSHRRTLSCGPSSRPESQFLEHVSKLSNKEQYSLKDDNRSTSSGIKQSGTKGGSRTEKVRIPNVIAKLMGLEELPLPISEAKKIEVQNNLKPNLVKEIGKTMTPPPNLIKREPDKIAYSAVISSRQNDIPQEEGLTGTKAKNSLYTVQNKGKKTVPTSLESMNNASNSSLKLPLKFSKHDDTANTEQSKEAKVVKKEAAETWEKASLKQRIRNDKSADASTIVESEGKSISSLRHESCDKTVRKKETEEIKNDMISKEQRNAQLVLDRSKSKQTGNTSTSELNTDGKVKVQTDVAKRRDVKVKNIDKSSNEMKTQVLSVTSGTVTSRNFPNINDKEQPKENQQSRHDEKQKLMNRSTAYHGYKMSENEKLEDRTLKSDAKTEKGKTLNLVLASSVGNPVQNPSAWKREVIKVIPEKKDNCNITLEEPTTTKIKERKRHELKQHTSFFLDLEHRWKERRGKDGATITSRSMNSEDRQQQKFPVTNLPCSSHIDDSKRSADQNMAVESNYECEQGKPLPIHRTTNTGPAIQQPLEAYFKEVQEQHSILMEDRTKGPRKKEKLRHNSAIKCLNLATSETDGQETLTKSPGNKGKLSNNSSIICLNPATSEKDGQGKLTESSGNKEKLSNNSSIICLNPATSETDEQGKLTESPGNKKKLSNKSSIICLNPATSKTDGQGKLTEPDNKKKLSNKSPIICLNPADGQGKLTESPCNKEKQSNNSSIICLNPATSETDGQGRLTESPGNKEKLSNNSSIICLNPATSETGGQETLTERPGKKEKLGNNSSIICLNLVTSETGQGTLTESEHALKQMLLNNQHFLNTAQALFKVNISISILQASENVYVSECPNIVLDCGYELMRRKGGREELMFGKRMSSATRVRCLDALIKELNRDLESLKFPRKIEDDDYDTAEFLHNMVAKDVHNRNPDVNSMWDFGWKSTMFANIEKEDIVRDLEKHLLNGLINDIARDLMNVSIVAL